jgi:hypothetical protein
MAQRAEGWMVKAAERDGIEAVGEMATGVVGISALRTTSMFVTEGLLGVNRSISGAFDHFRFTQQPD